LKIIANFFPRTSRTDTKKFNHNGEKGEKGKKETLLHASLFVLCAFAVKILQILIVSRAVGK
jgi:hypothetical protein